MKTLMVVTLFLFVMLMANSAFAVRNQSRVVDQYGNHLTLNGSTKFEWSHRFRHPTSGNLYPLNREQITWVYTKRYRQNKFHGWMAFGGVTAGCIDGYYQGYLQRGWDTWDEVERFWWIAGNTTLWGLALDSGYPDACRWMGGFQGGLAAISIIRQSDNDNLETISLAVGVAVGSYALGWLFDKHRKIPKRNTYSYHLRHSRR